MKETDLGPTATDAPAGDPAEGSDQPHELPPVRQRPRPKFTISGGGPVAKVNTEDGTDRSPVASKPANDQDPSEVTAVTGYVVGYKRPPARNQFQKGQSGNPKGRPKGCKNLRTLFEEELSSQVSFRENGKAKKAAKRQLIAKRTVNKAVEGDPKATDVILKLEGLLHAGSRFSGALGDATAADPQQDEIDRETIKLFLDMARQAPESRQDSPHGGDENDAR
jgi:hypothetical protein